MAPTRPQDAHGRIGVWTFGFSARPWSEARDAIAEVEDLGYGTIWIPEALTKDPFVTATALLGATERMSVATGIASIHMRTPTAMKAGWHALSETHPDRFVLGLGVSHAPMVEAMLGLPYDKPLTAMRTYLDAVDAAPYGGAAPLTTHRVLAALGPKMLALAAERADGAHPYNVTPEHTARAREVLGPDAWLAPEHKVIPTNDADEARRLGREALAVYLRLPNYCNNLRRLGFGDADLDDGGSDRLVDALFAWGDDERIAARVGEHFAAGADHVAVQVFRGYAEGALPVDDWRRLAPALLAL